MSLTVSVRLCCIPVPRTTSMLYSRISHIPSRVRIAIGMIIRYHMLGILMDSVRRSRSRTSMATRVESTTPEVMCVSLSHQKTV
ncbi:MAG: hypothetical protein A4E31_00718 [Methanomassiliicoccales archaeon PtaU1.Bin030]|nr:MAG: hypothetical protein A4E31_00718 [Methanomassiliicoccales archaeon PtaU1.Bin030]